MSGSRAKDIVLQEAYRCNLLQDDWTFWLDKGSAPGTGVEDFEAGLRKIFGVGTVEAYESVVENLPHVADLPPQAALHLMRGQRRPVWEDESNCRGGNWKFIVKRHSAPKLWSDLMNAAVNEQLTSDAGDKVIGVSVAVRDRDNLSLFVFQIWNMESSIAEKNSQIMDKVKEICGDIQLKKIFYKPFDTHRAFCQERLKNSPSKTLPAVDGSSEDSPSKDVSVKAAITLDS